MTCILCSRNATNSNSLRFRVLLEHNNVSSCKLVGAADHRGPVKIITSENIIEINQITLPPSKIAFGIELPVKFQYSCLLISCINFEIGEIERDGLGLLKFCCKSAVSKSS